jgi:hypothetical protein
MQPCQYLYTSTALVGLHNADVLRIVESAERENALRGITGLLLYCRGSFLQVLEGERALIDELVSRIMCDPRHHNFTPISCSPVAKREFADRPMGFRHVDVSDAAVLAHPAYIPMLAAGFDAKLLISTEGLALGILRLYAGQR